MNDTLIMKNENVKKITRAGTIIWRGKIAEVIAAIRLQALIEASRQVKS